MGTVGDCFDAVAESFFATLECELLDRQSWPAPAQSAILDFVETFYNRYRRSLDPRLPESGRLRSVTRCSGAGGLTKPPTEPRQLHQHHERRKSSACTLPAEPADPKAGGGTGVVVRTNVNTATRAELEAVSGSSQTMATAIVDNRPYTTLRDLYAKRIADKRELNAVIHLLTVADGLDETILVDTVVPLASANDTTEKFVGYAVSAMFFIADDPASTATRLERARAGVDSNQRAVIEIPAGLDVRGAVRIDVESPLGGIVHTAVLASIDDFRNRDLAPLTFQTTPTPPAPKTSATGPPSLLRGRLLDLRGGLKTEEVQLVFLATDKANAKSEDCTPVTVAVTERDGYFTTVYPTVTAKTIYAVAGIDGEGLPPQPIAPVNDAFPPRVLIVVDGSAVPPDAENKDDDCGCGELDFFGERRVLDEFTFFTVVRTTEPDVRRLVLDDDDEIDLADVIEELPDKWRPIFPDFGVLDVVARATTSATGTPTTSIARRSTPTPTPTPAPMPQTPEAKELAERIAGVRVKRSVLRDFTARQGVVTPENIADLIAANEKIRLRDRIIWHPPRWPRPTNVPGRQILGGDTSIDWDDEPTIHQAVSIAHGHLLQYRQEWIADGYSLGDLLYSLPLAPGQKKQLVVYDWSRRESAARTEALDYEEALANTLSRDRDINDIANAMVTETATGTSSASTSGWAVGGGIAAVIPIEVPIGGLFGGALGGGSGSSSSRQDATRQTSATSMQRLRDRTVQTANAVRSQRATVIQTVTQGERFQVQSESVANYNHCHALTMEYFEVLRHFLVQLRLVDVLECLFVPLLMSRFDIDKALRWRNTLARFVLDRRLRKGFAALERISSKYEGSDVPNGAYAEESIEYFEGDLFVEFRIARPHDKGDGEIELANWSWLGRLLPFINPVEFHNAYIKASNEKDRFFVERLGAQIAETFTSLLVVSVVTDTGEVQLPIDATLVSEFRHRERLFVSLRLGANLPPIRRDRISFVKISSRARDGQALSEFIPSNTKVVLRSGAMRYRTKHYSGALFDNASINNDIGAADDVRVHTPLSSEELRRPKAEDVELANLLLDHLNEHLEYFHKALWMSMTPERRFLLLDGVLGPEFRDPLTGNVVRRSLASVVENRVVGIVGNSLVMPVSPGLNLDPNFTRWKFDDKTGRPTGELVDLLDFYEEQPPEPLRVTVPTKGVYAEALMGRCNSCERKDDTRFWRWEESPIPDSPTAINPPTPPTPTVTTPNLQPSEFPTPIVNVQNAPAAPDPQGFGSLLQLLGRPDVFRDMTGLTENQRNALASMQRAFQSAEYFGGQASELAQFAGKMKVLQDAKEKGVLTNEQVQKHADGVAAEATGASSREEAKAARVAEKIRAAVGKADIDPEQGADLQQTLLRNLIGGSDGGAGTDKRDVLDIMNASADRGVGVSLASGGEQLDVRPATARQPGDDTDTMPPFDDDFVLAGGADEHELFAAASSGGLASSGGTGAGTTTSRTAKVHGYPHCVLERFDPATKTFVSGLKMLDPALVNPLFIDAAGDPVRDATLQQKLNAYVNSTLRLVKNRINIAVVDVTGGAAGKLFAPTYAGWRDETSVSGASIPKIAPMYAAWQLREDMNELASKDTTIVDPQTFAAAAVANWDLYGIRRNRPFLRELFTVDRTKTPIVDFTAPTLAILKRISFANVGPLIKNLGFPYIGSLMVASGMFDDANEGIWLSGGYGTGSWTGNPIRLRTPQNVTAFAVAKWFALLSQGRLVSRAASAEMVDAFATGYCLVSQSRNVSGVIAAKCGVLPQHGLYHDAVWIDDGTHQFVIVLLTTYADIDHTKTIEEIALML